MPRAARRCGRPGCDELVPCPDHKPAPWAGSIRRVTLPSNWTTIAARVLLEEPTCHLAYTDTWWTKRGATRCDGRSTEVDHIGSPTNHARANLRGVCTPCHRRRTQAQANAKRRRD